MIEGAQRPSNYNALSDLEKGERFRAAYQGLAELPSSSVSDAVLALRLAGISNPPTRVLEEVHFIAEAQRKTRTRDFIGPLTLQEQIIEELSPLITEEF